MRAEAWERTPIIRMVNVSLDAGAAGTLEDLVAATDDGLLVATDKSWSIDDIRLNFQFSCEIAWERSSTGKRTRILRDPFYTGITPRFWGSCDAVVRRTRLAPVGHHLVRQGRPDAGDARRHGREPGTVPELTVGSAS